MGRNNFFAFGGLQVNDPAHGSLSPSRHPYFAGGTIRRLSRGWALEGDFEATDKGASTEIAATWMTQLAQVRAAAVADPYMSLTYIDEKRISSSDGHSEILGFEALGGQRYRERSRSRDESGKWNISSSVITIKARTSFTVEHSYESFGEKITDVIQHNYCPTTQIPRAERVEWGDLSRR